MKRLASDAGPCPGNDAYEHVLDAQKTSCMVQGLVFIYFHAQEFIVLIIAFSSSLISSSDRISEINWSSVVP